MRGAGVDAVRRKEAACGRHTAMTVHHAHPAVRDRVSNVSSSLAAETARKREIKESDFGSGGERTCSARYPSWVRHHLGYAPGHGRLIVPPATLRRPQRRPRIVPTAPKTLHISSEITRPASDVDLRSKMTKVTRLEDQGEKEKTIFGTRMPVVEGEIHGQRVSVLRDSGTNTVLVRKSLVNDEELTGEYSSVLLVDSSVRWLPEAKIFVSTPYYTGSVVAKCLEEPLYDLVIGNLPGVRQVDNLDREWTMGQQGAQKEIMAAEEEYEEKLTTARAGDQQSGGLEHGAPSEGRMQSTSSAVATRAATSKQRKVPQLRRVWTWPVREGQQFFLPVKLFGGGQLSRVSGGRYGQTFSEDAMPAKGGMVRALCAGAKEEEAAAQARTHRSKGKKERKRRRGRRRRRKHTDLGMRGAGVDAVQRKEAACGRHTASRSNADELAAATARKRKIKQSDSGSGGERTCGARYPSWVRHHLGYAPGHGRLIVPPATLRRPQRRPRIVPTAPKTLHISSGIWTLSLLNLVQLIIRHIGH
ncbi:hypothetical protein HPB50_011733 [Hyalomma asiaticum]|uniref:Uncharacterized protein n=1 Tax=Hyalomma asiaticum TaxID=266040 RepID=A0ACB7SDW7_HYAAI|nr:hypothetical protein HPB50_011733 [Hyalomma asiaticum]